MPELIQVASSAGRPVGFESEARTGQTSAIPANEVNRIVSSMVMPPSESHDHRTASTPVTEPVPVRIREETPMAEPGKVPSLETVASGGGSSDPGSRENSNRHASRDAEPRIAGVEGYRVGASRTVAPATRKKTESVGSGRNESPARDLASGTPIASTPPSSVAPPESKVSGSSESKSHHPLETRPLELGMPAASMGTDMFKESTSDKIAGTAAQPLPGELSHRSLPAQDRSLTAIVSPMASVLLPVNASTVSDGALKAGLNPDRMAESVDRLQTLLVSHASTLQVGRMDEIRAVLRPDSTTEIHLHVKRDADQIQMTAHCPGGDVAAWQVSWGDLQQRLKSQGISLQPLEVGPRGGDVGQHPDRPRSQSSAPGERDGGRQGSGTERRAQSDSTVPQETIQKKPGRRVTPRVTEYWA